MPTGEIQGLRLPPQFTQLINNLGKAGSADKAQGTKEAGGMQAQGNISQGGNEGINTKQQDELQRKAAQQFGLGENCWCKA